MHRHRQNKDGVYWYRCETQWKVHKDACFQVSVKEEELQSQVLAMLNKQAEAIMGGHIRVEHEAPVMDAAGDAELNQINKRLSSSGQFLKSLYENMLDGLITADEFASMKVGYEKEIEALSKRADDIRAQRRERASRRETFRRLSGAVSEAISAHELTADVAQRLVEKIEVSRDKSFDVDLRFRDEFKEVKRVG
jgi:hypothetical protein